MVRLELYSPLFNFCIDTVSIDGDDDDGLDGKMGPLSVNGQIKAKFYE